MRRRSNEVATARTVPRGRLRRAVPPLAVAAAGAACLALIAGASAGTGPVAVVDERPIEAAALRFYAEEIERTVEDDIRNGRLPTEDLDGAIRERALQLAIQDAELFQLGREEGLTEIDGHEDLEADLVEENEARRAALASGEIVYGSTGFDLSGYRAKVVTELRSALEREYLSGPGAPGEAELRAEFDSDPSAWALAATTYDLRVLIVPFASATAERCAEALASSASVDAIASSCDRPIAVERYDGAQPPAQASPQHARLSAAMGLAVGERSQPQAEPEGVSVVELVAAETDADLAFATYRDRIAAVVAERWLDELLDRRLASSDIDINAPRLAAVDLKESKR